MLYLRLFPQKRVRWVIYSSLVILIGLGISTFITTCVACIPFSANWDVTEPGARCINKENFFIWSSIPNIVTDIAILALPVPIVWNLQTSTRLKIGLTVTFGVGSLDLITSIIRFTTFFRLNSFTDTTFAAVDLQIWTQIEPGVYLISACLMTYRPLLERIGRGRFVGKIRGSKKDSTNNRSGTGDTLPLKAGAGAQGSHKLGNDGKGRGILRTTDMHVDVDEELGKMGGYSTHAGRF